MILQKESNFEKQKIKFTVEMTVEEAKEYAKGLQIEYPVSLDIVPDMVLLEIIKYKLDKNYAKKQIR